MQQDNDYRKRIRPPICPKSPNHQFNICQTEKKQQKKSTNKIQRGSEDLKKYFAEDRIQDLSKNNEYQQKSNVNTDSQLNSMQIQPKYNSVNKDQSQNFLKRSHEMKISSHLIKKTEQSSYLTHEDKKRIKSKSALNYAKYFMKQVSNIATEPSSNEANISAGTQQKYHQNSKKQIDHFEDIIQQKLQEETVINKQISSSAYNHKSRLMSERTKLSQRLKSIKNIRKSSKEICSIEKKCNSASKRKNQSVQKKVGNTTGLSSQSSKSIFEKSRARTKKMILKLKKLHQVPEESLFLQINSKINHSYGERRYIIQKVELHLQALNLIANYVKQFKNIYEDVQCWQELIFLSYKKFYIERLKVQNSLNLGNSTQYPNLNQNPYILYFSKITLEQLSSFKLTKDAVILQQKLQRQNKQIKQSLRNFYNHIIEKSGRYINLYECDDFSNQIYLLIRQQIKLLRQCLEDEYHKIRIRRINLCIKCCLLIGYLNGKQSKGIQQIFAQNQYSQTYYAQYIEVVDNFID